MTTAPARAEGCTVDAVDIATVLIEDDEGNTCSESSSFAVCAEHRDQLLHRVLTMGLPPPDEWDWAT